ncbi:MAG TPA: VCBS repeat-containing protein [Lysobacter sp.]|nr:VCBS repeat-containing protein [Lysobacter sp.]
MNHQPVLSILAIALLGSSAIASATEWAGHNDMDGDGRSDLIWRNSGTGAIVYWPAANATSRIKLPYTNGLRIWSPAFAISDFWDNLYDQTSKNDLVLRNSSGGVGFFNPYDGSIATDSEGPFPFVVDHGDFDGNGLADILSRDPTSGLNHVQFGAMVGNFIIEGATTYQQLPTVGLAWKVAGVGDFDGDGRSDILWRDASTGANSIWRSGNVATRLKIASVPNLDWKIAAIGDYDGDGRSDILWRNMRSGVNVIWRSGNNLTPQAVAKVSSMAWKVAATGDFNGDGKWDLAWRNSVTGANVLWKSAKSTTRQALPTVAVSWSLVM